MSKRQLNLDKLKQLSVLQALETRVNQKQAQQSILLKRCSSQKEMQRTEDSPRSQRPTRKVVTFQLDLQESPKPAESTPQNQMDQLRSKHQATLQKLIDGHQESMDQFTEQQHLLHCAPSIKRQIDTLLKERQRLSNERLYLEAHKVQMQVESLQQEQKYSLDKESRRRIQTAVQKHMAKQRRERQAMELKHQMEQNDLARHLKTKLMAAYRQKKAMANTRLKKEADDMDAESLLKELNAIEARVAGSHRKNQKSSFY